MPFAPLTPHQGHLWAGRTVGLLGGSFNPAHEGHRHISLMALKHLRLDAVWWMVSPQNPMKSAKDMDTIDNRLESARVAAAHPRILPTDIERQMGTRFTIDTLRALKRHFPATRFVWLMGTDNLHQFHRWGHWEDIFNTVPICVMDRPPQGSSLAAAPAAEKFRHRQLPESAAGRLAAAALPAWVLLRIPLNPTSSTAIRAARAAKKR